MSASSQSAEDHPGLSSEASSCPTSKQLAEAVRQNDLSQFSTHLKECEICAGVVSYLQEPAPDSNLYKYIKETKDRAAVARAKRPSSALDRMRAAFSLGQPWWVTTGLALSALMLLLTWGLNLRPSSQGPMASAGQVAFEEDVYTNTINMLQTSAEKMDAGRVSPEERRAAVDQINSKIMELRQVSLDDKQKTEFGKLQARFQVALVRQAGLERQGGAANVPTFNPSAEGHAVTAFYTAVGREVRPKKSPTTSESPAALAETATRGAQEVEVVRVGTDEVTVRDLDPERTDTEWDAVERGMRTFLIQENKPIVYQNGEQTVRFTSADAVNNANLLNQFRTNAFTKRQTGFAAAKQ